MYLTTNKESHITAARTSSGSSNKVPFVIELLPIGVPEQLDITQVVLRQDGNTMLVLNNDRWLSPPQKKCIQPFHPR
ncbi:hypothetical protein DMH27_03715 [Raoultella planticola]|nr:hypothetical protein [Raoultella planticola]